LVQTAYKRNREQTCDGEQDDDYNHGSKGTSLQILHARCRSKARHINAA
jgi:hypothetical protein